MKALPIAGLCLLASALAGCANVRGPVPAALAYYNGPITINQAASVTAEKRGEACAHNILGLVATGNASLDAAKQNGSISRVASVEQNTSQVGGYYARFCTIVHGE